VVMGRVSIPNSGNAFTAIHLIEVSTGVINPDCNVTTINETPFIAEINLYISNGKIHTTNTDAKLTIFDTVGRQMSNENLKQGVYIVVVQVDGKTTTHKVMF